MNRERYTHHVHELSLSVVQTKVDSIRKKDILRTGLRVYADGKIGVAGALGSFDEGDLTQRAIAALDLQIPYPHELAGEHVEAVFHAADGLAGDAQHGRGLAAANLRTRRAGHECVVSGVCRRLEQHVAGGHDAGAAAAGEHHRHTARGLRRARILGMLHRDIVENGPWPCRVDRSTSIYGLILRAGAASCRSLPAQAQGAAWGEPPMSERGAA